AEYTLQDGTILEGGQAKTADDGRPAAPGKVDTLDIQKAYERANKLAGQAKGKVFKTTITPHWFHNNTRFWYRNDAKDDTRDFVLVDVEKGTRLPAFDHARLAEALSKAAGAKYDAKRLPFQSIQFTDDRQAVQDRVHVLKW